MRRFLWVCAVWAGGCDDGGSQSNVDDGGSDLGVEGDASVDGDAGDDGSVDVPDAAPIALASTPYVINIVDADAANAVTGFLALEGGADIAGAARAVYDVLPDDYDFLYLFAPVHQPNAAGGRYVRVRSPALPSVGLDQAADDSSFGSGAQLKGVVALNPNPVGNGPTLHETLHHWGTFLDQSFGLGRDRETNFGAHWGTAGVNGQHGGFLPGSLRCEEPADSLPPCAAGPDGRAVYVMPAFGPGANGGDGLPYAPIELYLMGLVPADDVPPFEVLVDASFIEFVEATDTFRMSAAGIVTHTIEDIVALHGARPPAEQTDFRAAFAVVTAEPLSEADLAAYDTWAQIFGGVMASNFLTSFEEATGDRATMDVRLFGD